MAVYCEKIEGLNVPCETGNAEKILVIGCPSCTNISLSVNTALPFIRYSPAGINPVCTKMEIDNISKSLAEKGIQVDSWLPRNLDPLCCMHKNVKNKLAEKHNDAKCIIVVSCEAGEDCVKEIFPRIKTVRTMSAKGILTCTVKSGKISEVFVDKPGLKIRRFDLNDK